jgi:hypothetical protein
VPNRNSIGDTMRKKRTDSNLSDRTIPASQDRDKRTVISSGDETISTRLRAKSNFSPGELAEREQRHGQPAGVLCRCFCVAT